MEKTKLSLINQWIEAKVPKCPVFDKYCFKQRKPNRTSVSQTFTYQFRSSVQWILSCTSMSTCWCHPRMMHRLRMCGYHSRQYLYNDQGKRINIHLIKRVKWETEKYLKSAQLKSNSRFWWEKKAKEPGEKNSTLGYQTLENEPVTHR